MKTPEHQGSNGNRVVFEEPTSLAQAKTRRTTLIEEISNISAQLSNRNKQTRCTACRGNGCQACGETGSVRLTDHQYHQWRQGALTALRARENTLRRLNAWIEEHTESPVPIRPETSEEKLASSEADRLVKEAYEALVRLRDDLDGDLDDDEMDLIVRLGNYVNPHPLRKTGT